MNIVTMNMLYQNQKARQEQPANKSAATTPTKVTKQQETLDNRVPPGYSCLGEYYDLSCDDCPGYCHESFNKTDYLKEFLDVLPEASVEACITQEDCDALLARLGLSKE